MCGRSSLASASSRTDCRELVGQCGCEIAWQLVTLRAFLLLRRIGQKCLEIRGMRPRFGLPRRGSASCPTKVCSCQAHRRLVLDLRRGVVVRLQLKPKALDRHET
jgi:hypothetical protein